MGMHKWRRILFIVGGGLLLYFGNVEVQTYLGRKALKETGLEILGLNEALAQAKDQKKYVLVNLSAIWCPSCRSLDRNVLSDEKVRSDIQAQFVYARLEYESDAGKSFMKTYKIDGFPTLAILNADGSLLKKLPLSYNPEEFRRQLML